MKIFFYTFAVLLVFVFQNCSRVSFFGVSNIPQENLTPNGEGYSGRDRQFTFYVAASDVTEQVPIDVPVLKQMTISPDLPKGLRVDPTSGIIGGTPLNVTAGYDTYTANELGTDGSTSTVLIHLGVGHVYRVDPNIDGLGNDDANLEDGLCLTKADLCSFNAALEQAGANTVKTRIILPPKTYLLGGLNLNINANVDIFGSGQGLSVLDGNSSGRVLSVMADDVSIEHLSISHGKSDPETGAAIRVTDHSTNLTINDVEVSFNQSPPVVTGGGAIYFDGDSLIISRSHLHDNSLSNTFWTGLGGGAILLDADTQYFELTDSLVENNIAFAGGAIFFQSTNMTANLDGNVFKQNQASQFAGAIYVGNNVTGIAINNCVFIQNSNSISGGAISFYSGGNSITNTTFSGNQAGYGAAIFAALPSCVLPSDILTINESTFADNNGGVINGIALCAVHMTDTIIGNNSSTPCLFSFMSDPQISNSIDAGNTCGFPTGHGNLVNTDPVLGPLTQYGDTFAYPLLPTSPAIDSGSNCEVIDQRGVERPRGLNCDIGAFEY